MLDQTYLYDQGRTGAGGVTPHCFGKFFVFFAYKNFKQRKTKFFVLNLNKNFCCVPPPPPPWTLRYAPVYDVKILFNIHFYRK